MIEADVIECVLGLGPKLFYNSPMYSCVVICRMNKHPDLKGNILFMNDSKKEVEVQKTRDFLKIIIEKRFSKHTKVSEMLMDLQQLNPLLMNMRRDLKEFKFKCPKCVYSVNKCRISKQIVTHWMTVLKTGKFVMRNSKRPMHISATSLL